MAKCGSVRVHNAYSEDCVVVGLAEAGWYYRRGVNERLLYRPDDLSNLLLPKRNTMIS